MLSGMLAAMIVLHWAHVFCGIFWFGTILYTRIMLFPSLRTLGPEQEAKVRAAMVAGPSRRITLMLAWGTVSLGMVRGAAAGAFDQLTSAYGITYLASLLLGLAMAGFVTLDWPKGQLPRHLYVAGFPAIFTLMVLMRFGL